MLKNIGFLSGSEEFFLLARKEGNYEEAYLDTLTNNPADWRRKKEKEPFPEENYLEEENGGVQGAVK